MATLVAATLVTAAIGLAVSSGDVYRGAIIVGGLVALAFIAHADIVSLRAPNAIVYPATAGTLALAWTMGINAGLDAIAGAGTALVAFAILAVIGRGAMGMGDVKTAALCGALTGVEDVAVFLLATFVAGAVFAAAVLMLGLRQRRDAAALTPFMALGVLIALASPGGYLGS